MRFLRKSSIQRKLAVVVLCASCLGLSVTCLDFALYERSSYRAAMTTALSTLADTLGANMAASLALDDRQSARDTLTALRAAAYYAGAAAGQKRQSYWTRRHQPRHYSAQESASRDAKGSRGGRESQPS